MIAAIFPGQGSQRPGMGRELAEAFTPAKQVFSEVSEATGIDLERLCWETDEETLRLTQNAQLALFTTSLAAYRELTSRPGVVIEVVAGHSVGEYAALVAAGIYDLSDAAKLVQARGEAMADAGASQPGTMAAILGLDAEDLTRLCAEADGIVVVANDNSPGQVVISGELAAVADVCSRAALAGAKRTIPLNVSGAFHSPLMQTASSRMRTILDSYTSNSAQKKIYANVTAEQQSEGFVWPDLLERQLRSPVRWTESVQHMVRDGVHTVVECGVGEVLCGLVRRIDKNVICLKANDPSSLGAAILALASS